MQLLLPLQPTRAGIFSIDRILLTNAGAGYQLNSQSPLPGGGGVFFFSAMFSSNSSNFGIVDLHFQIMELGMHQKPTVTITGEFMPVLQRSMVYKQMSLKNAGIVVVWTVTISNPSLIA